MDEFTAVEAAKWLGVSREAVDLAAREGRLPVVAGDGPRRFSREALEEFHQGRQAEKIAKLARSGESPVSVAGKVRRGLFAGETGLPRPFAVKLAAMPVDWRTLFNKAELAAACVPDGEGCRWCRCAEFSGFLGLRPTPYAPAYAALFDQPPCGVCAPRLLKPYMQALEARVHRGAVRPSEAAPPTSAAERAQVQEWALQRAVTAAAKPVKDDDGGRALVARRLREVRARAKTAKRAGDQKYALRLAQVARDLEQDAARVDGRALTAAAGAKPRVARFMGSKACGTPVGQSCACHPGPKRRGRR